MELQLIFYYIFTGLTVFAVSNANVEEQLLDTKEGDDLTLRCRFTEKYSSKEFVLQWGRSTRSYSNVAFNDVPLNINYRYVLFFYFKTLKEICHLPIESTRKF